MDNSLEQTPFDAFEFAENPEPRCPCILLLDTSGSMQGEPIRELNAGLVVLKDELASDSLAAKRAEIAIITFGPVSLKSDFQTVDTFVPPTLTANGDTPMGAAIELALAKVQERKQEYQQAGVAYYRPWIFLITDGGPTDSWQHAAEQVRQGEDKGTFSFFAVGVEGARMDILEKIAKRAPLKLKGLRFRDLFIWLSKSMRKVSQSKPGDTVALDNPATPEGWASV